MNEIDSNTFESFSNIDEFLKINIESDLFDTIDDDNLNNDDVFTNYFKKLQPKVRVPESTSNIDDDEFFVNDITNINDPILKTTTNNLMFSLDPLEDQLLNENTLHKDSNLPSLTSSSSSTSASSTTSINEYTTFKNQEFNQNNQDLFTDTLNIQPFDDDNQFKLTSFKAESTPEITSPLDSDNSQQQTIRKSSLDSRLSLQRLGEILKTSSSDETMRIEKFILNIFEKDLGFPLGYKTWIRDTNENHRKYLLDEVYKRVNPTYPELTKSLLETVIKRATYSMMQGRLRKERRALTKANRKKNLK